MRMLVVFFFTVCISLCASAQDKYVFKADTLVCPSVAECPPNQYLSKELRVKLEQFNLLYSKKIDLAGQNFPTSTEIIKPDLYYSVQRLSRYFCKCMKKGTISKENAETEFRSILEKCLLIVQKDTAPLEAELRITNNPAELVGVFDRIVITN